MISSTFFFYLRNHNSDNIRLSTDLSGHEISQKNDSGSISKSILSCICLTKFAQIPKSHPKDSILDANSVHSEDYTEYSKGRVVLRNLPFNCSEDEIRSVLIPFGPLSYIDILTKIDSTGKLCRVGCAFAQFIHSIDANRVTKYFSILKIKNRPVSVDLAIPKQIYSTIKPSVDAEVKNKDCNQLPQLKTNLKRKISQIEESEGVSSDVSQDNMKPEKSKKKKVANVEEKINKDSNKSIKTNFSTQPPATKVSEADLGLFVQNLSSETSKDRLIEWVQNTFQIRPVSCNLVNDRETGLPKGSAFLYFKTTNDVQSILKLAKERGNFYSTQEKPNSRSLTDQWKESFPEFEGSTCDGRIPLFAPILSKKDLDSTIENRKEEMNEKRSTDKLSWGHKTAAMAVDLEGSGQKDARNLHLMKLGVVLPKDPAYKKLSPVEQKRHLNAWKEKCSKLKSDSNYFISPVRLCIRNIPVSVTSQILSLAVTRLLKSKRRIKRCIIIKSKKGDSADSEDQDENAGTQDEDSEKQSEVTFGRSRGFAFLTFYNHEDARKILDHLSNADASDIFSNPSFKNRKLIAEFALENAAALEKQKKNKRSRLK